MIGLLGNIMSIIVWRKRLLSKAPQNSSTVIYLLMLSLCDSLVLVNYLFHEMVPVICPTITTNSTYALVFAKVSHPLFYILHLSSVWIVTSLTIQRFVVVRFPMKAKALFSTRRTIASISAIFILSAIFCLPSFFILGVSMKPGGVAVIENTVFGASQQAGDFKFTMHCMALLITPWVIVAVLNVFIVTSLRRHRKFRNSFYGN